MIADIHAHDPRAHTMPASADDTPPDHYTGVVIIHGIGDEKRNETLQEALNALSYWFNQRAGLALRPEGPGRVWLRTRLTISNNPDAEASQATIELRPPSALAAATGSAEPLCLEMREVWWAQTFGLPSVGSALRWARVQFWEEWLRVLLPLGRRSGPAHAARQAPAREIPQALTYRPTPAGPDQQPRLPAESSAGAATPLSGRVRRWAMEAALGLYGFVQYIWKSLQWLLLAPFVFLLLMLVSIAKLLAIIPFIQTAVLKGLASLVEYVSLHWIAPMQVYLLDYTRSSTIRQLFERELRVFLEDEHCDRIVVLAHSMGTVIAYEGLTTLLSTEAARRRDKPLTFVSLGQALRRMWLLVGTDVHRLRVALPSTVRWLNFWARYDPVSAGPLSETSLPRIEQWLDPEMANPHDAICQALNGCENVDIVNADSLFSDHTSYWQNMEQVVGPIARELVAAHPALKRLADDHQASAADVLMRRWNVAWRAISSLLGAIGAAGLLLLVNATTSLQIGTRVRELLQTLDIASLIGATFGPIGVGVLDLIPNLRNTGHTAPAPVTTLAGVPYPVADAILTALVALAVLSITRALIERFLAEPSPFTWRAFGRQDRGAWGIYLFTFPYVALVVAMLVLVVQYDALLASSTATQADIDALNTRFNVIFAIFGVVSLIAWLVALSDAKYRQRWGWFAVIFVTLPLALVSVFVNSGVTDLLPFYAAWMIGFPLAAALTLSVLFHTARHGRWPAFLVMLPTLPIAALGAALVAPMVPVLLYGLLVGPGTLRPGFARENRAWPLSLATLGLLLLLLDYAVAASIRDLAQTSAVVGITALGVVSGIVIVASWIVGMVHIARRRRWVWLIVVPLLSGLSWLFSAFFLLATMQQACPAQSCTLTQGGFPGLISQIAFGLAPGLLAGILTFGLIAAPSKSRTRPTSPQPVVTQPVPMGVPRVSS